MKPLTHGRNSRHIDTVVINSLPWIMMTIWSIKAKVEERSVLNLGWHLGQDSSLVTRKKMHHGTRSGDGELRKTLLFAVYGFPLLFSSTLQEPAPSLGKFASFKAASNCTDYMRSHCLWLSSCPSFCLVCSCESMATRVCSHLRGCSSIHGNLWNMTGSPRPEWTSLHFSIC